MAAPDTIHQILNTAGEVFANKGFKDATIREISAQAGVNLAAINYHFGDKERLYIEAVKNARNLLAAAVPMPEMPESMDPEVKLLVFIQTLARRLLNRNVASWQHGLLVREFMNPSRACEEMMQESILPLIEQLHAILRQLMPSDVPKHIIQQLGFSIISQCVYYRFQERIVSMLVRPPEFEEHYTPDALADHIAKFSIAAVRAYDSIHTFT